jgi:RimJ/RimL family protein N-acetyltransferase
MGVQGMEGKYVNIRPLNQKDLDWFTEWNNNPEYKGPFEPHEFITREEISKWHKSEKLDEWWVIENKQGNPMGQLVTGPQGDCYWLGYIIHPIFRNKGYTTEAVKLLINHLFKTKDIIRIQAECSLNNKASIKVLDKAGFTYEGLKRKVTLIQGEYLDGAMYSILKDEWKK